MKKVNIVLVLVVVILLVVVIFFDVATLNSLYYGYDDTFVVNYIDTSNRNDSIVYNEVNVARVSMVSNNRSNKWYWPTVGNYILTGRFNGYHNAIDIASSNGSNIYAANSGEVVMVKGGCVVGNLSCNGRGGNYIIIKHFINNYYTVYMHLRDIKVVKGQVVGGGEVIGTMGNTGNVIPVPLNSSSTAGTHLHFCLYIGEPYRGGYAINPMSVY